jgi:hypothetical protein
MAAPWLHRKERGLSVARSSALVMPPRARSVSATRAGISSAGWQQVNTRRSRSSTIVLSSSMDVASWASRRISRPRARRDRSPTGCGAGGRSKGCVLRPCAHGGRQCGGRATAAGGIEQQLGDDPSSGCGRVPGLVRAPKRNARGRPACPQSMEAVAQSRLRSIEREPGWGCSVSWPGVVKCWRRLRRLQVVAIRRHSALATDLLRLASRVNPGRECRSRSSRRATVPSRSGRAPGLPSGTGGRVVEGVRTSDQHWRGTRPMVIAAFFSPKQSLPRVARG